MCQEAVLEAGCFWKILFCHVDESSVLLCAQHGVWCVHCFLNEGYFHLLNHRRLPSGANRQMLELRLFDATGSPFLSVHLFTLLHAGAA